MPVTLHAQTEKNLDAVENNESFATVFQWGTQLLCYEPDREPYEFVVLSKEQVDIDAENKEHLDDDAIIYGEKSAWDETPLYHLSD